MTDKKEEILNSHVPCDCYKRLRLKDQCKICVNHSILLDAMTEYADLQSKERAIGFLDWYKKLSYDELLKPLGKYGQIFKTSDELYTEYEIFTKQK